MVIDRTDLAKLAAALGGLPVLACRPGSPAALAGVRYGDIVLAVNGIKTPDWATFIEARGTDAAKMRLLLFRDGTEVDLEIELSTTPLDPAALLAEIIAERIVPLDVPLSDKKKPDDRN
ncbi:MAG TPA: PDZ domain-containing protein [Kofleriaceae bacterium]